MTQFAANFDLSSLDGINGFKITGLSTVFSPGVVYGDGDFNGDGIDDIIIGAAYATSPNGSGSGETYVVFGSHTPFPADFAVSALDGSNGFRINGVAAGDNAGFDVAFAGDVNGDGYDDAVVAAWKADPHGSASGHDYVVFGHAGGFPAAIDLSSLDGTNGFALSGEAANDKAGYYISSAGDFNGDGFYDVLIGAPYAGVTHTGVSYIVFGKASGFAANIDLSSLDGTNGFRLNGVSVGDNAGASASPAGDLNGDGFDDVVVGARHAAPNGTGSGASYVVFGKASGFGASFDLSALDGSNGFAISGEQANDASGFAVANAGDVNGDGYADVLIGSVNAPNNARNGAAYVVFGKASGFSANVQLSSLDGSNGFKLSGAAASDYAGFWLSAAGDVNGDGFADVLVGAKGADVNGSYSGASYVVFGKASGFAANIDPSSLDGDNGFTIRGAAAGDKSGYGVSAAGDVNGDGFDDIMVSDLTGDGSGPAAYIIYGHGPDDAVVRTGSDGANTIHGSEFADTLAGQGGNDLLLGGAGNDTIKGGSGDDVIRGGDGDDTLVGDKGTDQLFGENGDDTFLMANRLRADDKLDGGAGTDVLKLDGDYSFGLRFAPTTIANIEEIKVQDGFSYDLRLDDANVAAGQTLIVSGLALTGSNSLAVDGSRETDGSFKLYGGAGADHFTGGAGADVMLGGAGDDTLMGGGGSDVLTGGAGSDTFVYRNVTDLLGAAVDAIRDFDASTDRIDLWFNLNGVDASQSAASLGQLGTVFDAAHLGVQHAALATVGSHTYIVIDANSVAGYQAGADLLIRIDGATQLGQFGAASFV